MSTEGRPDRWAATREIVASSPECEPHRQATASIAALALVAAGCGTSDGSEAAADEPDPAPSSSAPAAATTTSATSEAPTDEPASAPSSAAPVVATTAPASEDSSPPPPQSDDELAEAALVELSELEPLLNASASSNAAELWQNLAALQRAQPACADHSAALDAAGEPTAGATRTVLADDSWEILGQTVTVYETAEVAGRVMDTYDVPEFQNCLTAFWDAGLTAGATDGPVEPVSTMTEVAAPIEAGDRQMTFGITTENGTDPRGPVLYHIVFAQFDRVVVALSVSEDGLGSESARGFVQLTLPPTVAAVEDALAAS